MGHSLLASHEVNLHGTYMGIAGDSNITHLVEESDTLILLDVLLSDSNFGVSEKKIDLRKTITACDHKVSIADHINSPMPIADLVNSLIEKMTEKFPVSKVSGEYSAQLERDEQAITFPQVWMFKWHQEVAPSLLLAMAFFK